MKRKKAMNLDFTNIVDDERVLKDEIATPVRLTPETLAAMTVDFNGYKFIQIPILACTNCGSQAQIQVAHAPDKEIYFFLRFTCGHYKNPKDTAELPANATAEPTV